MSRFPCPVCTRLLDVRQTKKQKPYVVCDPCGVQMFVRNSAGIGKPETLINKGEAKDLFKRLTEIESRYLKQCPECGNQFWITHDLLKTSWFDGEAQGYKCPHKNCEGFVKEAK